MKRLSLFFAALIAAAATFAGTVVYDLQGGVTNDYGWKSVDEMFAAFMTESGATDFLTLAEYKALEEPLAARSGICVKLTNPETAFANTEKWGWLKSYIESVHLAQAADGASTLPENGAGAAWRYAIAAFFTEGQRTGWPKSADFSQAGKYEAWQPVWGHAWDNPTTVDAEWTLNAPYKEGETFRGWYDNAAGSGTAITTIDAEFNGTLYACFGEYVMTIAEANAALNDSVLAGGTVVFVRGTSNVYIQDATAGTLLYLAKNEPAPAVGEYVVVWGKSVTYKGAQEISGAKIRSHVAGTLPDPQNILLSTFLAAPLNYFAERLHFDGLKITAHDNSGMYVTDGVDTIQCFNMKVDQAVFPVGSRVNLNCVGSYYDKAQLVGDSASVEAAPLAGKDSYAYPARGENGEYTLVNKWIYSVKKDNYIANRPANTNFCRGMAAYDGKMYFIDREHAAFTVVDGATGEMLDPLPITGEHLFQKYDAESDTWKDDVTLKFNDVKFDNAGHCLISACASNSQGVYVYVVDLATGAATELINEHLYDNPDFYTDEENKDSWRMDAIGVYGDVTGKAVVMFGNSMNADLNAAYKWDINNGVAGAAERIDLVINAEDETYMLKEDGTVAAENNSACQVFPVDFNYFYWDHHSCRPTLFDMGGVFVEDLKSCPTGVAVGNNEGDTCKVGLGHNGICEFQIGPDYFVIMAATNTAEVPASSFVIYKFADASKAFSGLTPMWFLPNEGMGAVTNAYRTAVPTVEVDGTKATIYLYSGENGYAVYEMTGREAPKPIEKLYVTGNIEGNNWNAESPIEMTAKGNQVFEAELTFVAASADNNLAYFAFSAEKGSWDAFNGARYGAANQATVAAGAPVALTNDGSDLTVTILPGTYTVTADMENLQVSVAEITAVDNVVINANVTKRVENGQLIIIRNGVRYNAQGVVAE